MANQNISKLLQNKIEFLKAEVENAKADLQQWQTIEEEYNQHPEKFELLAGLLTGENSEAKKSKKKV
ncbi:hypothetical protein [Pedobacter mendelii]|uniref:Uncharacterized protein n=1 Tax=Pedobacter mendelii TaxID=1908240 RepID=A0ABQ2BPD0_9SPHI|nr:hypothetical protein [Pedobacter mendelii]GGI29125.1 hypothetical protein GCM10008119_36080 [Pedobacter mendelii]